MATIQSSWSALGVGSGLDLESLVTGLMNVERAPLDRLNSQLSSYNTKISALGTLTSKLSALQTTAKGMKPSVLQSALDKFGTYTGKLGNENVAGVVLGAGAKTGSYSLEVTQLAQAQKVRIDGGDVNIGGKIDFSFAADPSKNFSVTPSGSSLASVANAINQAGKGMTATVINGGASGQQLVLTGEEGATKAFTVGGAGIGGSVNTVQAAQDAHLSIDGIAVTSSSNTVKDVIEGVTLELKATNAGAPTTLSITAEHGEKIKAALEGFVKSFNDAIGSVKTLGAYDSETKKKGDLNGHSVLRDAQSELRNLVFQQSAILDKNGEAMTLSKLGITFQKDGTLALDSDKLAKAVNDDATKIAGFVAEVGGRFDIGLNKLSGVGGTVQSVSDSLKSSVTSLEKRKLTLEDRMVSVEARYRQQFSALDTQVSKLNSMSSFLATQLAALTKNNK
ncbi:MAG: flagellar filament capping protein FliD [Azoarcus sp.]|jgi:flagellar hook-associated protein 2|nr:flagellar filament capping protein FliD [Azoarcus sp.]